MPFNTNVYNITWKRLVVWLLPTLLRRPLLVEWLLVLISPVIKLFNQFMAFRKAAIYQLGITPQVCYLEKALNDRYDKTLRRIYIKDAVEYNALPLFLKIENKPLVLSLKSENKPLVLYTKGETSLFTVDFIVMVPTSVFFNTVEMRAFIDSYKLLSKTYQIQLF